MPTVQSDDYVTTGGVVVPGYIRRISATLQPRPDRQLIARVLRGYGITQGNLGFPFCDTETYYRMMQLRRVLAGINRDRDRAFKFAKTAVLHLQDHTSIALHRVWELNQFGEVAQRMLAMGAGIAAIGGGLGFAVGTAIAVGAGAGSAVPGIGTLVGCCVGVVIGVGLAILPFDKWSFLDEYRKTIASLPVAVRYLVLASFEQIVTDARAQESKGALPPWRLSGGELLTIWGGVDALAFFAFQQVWEMDCLPTPPTIPTVEQAKNDPYTMYGLAVCGTELNDDEPLKASREYDKCVNAYSSGQSPNRWIAPIIYEYRDKESGSIRKRAIDLGMPDMSVQPVPNFIADQLVEYEKSIANAPRG